MDPSAILFSICVVIVVVTMIYLSTLFHKTTIMEYQRGLVYRQGKFIRTLEPGRYRIYHPNNTVITVDTRTKNIILQGQEMLSADNVGIRMSITISFNIADPYLAINKVIDYQDTLYQTVQLKLRDLVGAIEIEALLENRNELNKQLFALSKPAAEEIGLNLSLISIRDIMFPGDLRNIFAQVVNAKYEGLAALERARGEMAALRNLANGAKVLENNPALMQLRTLQALEKSSGNSIVFTTGDNPFIQNENKNKAQ